MSFWYHLYAYVQILTYLLCSVIQFWKDNCVIFPTLYDSLTDVDQVWEKNVYCEISVECMHKITIQIQIFSFANYEIPAQSLAILTQNIWPLYSVKNADASLALKWTCNIRHFHSYTVHFFQCSVCWATGRSYRLLKTCCCNPDRFSQDRRTLP